jgi:hypothetical protein
MLSAGDGIENAVVMPWTGEAESVMDELAADAMVE